MIVNDPYAAARELVRRHAAANPPAFASVCGFELDAWQAETLASPARGILLNCSRQSGKSTVASLAAVLRAVSKPGALVLLVSPSLRQSGELFEKVKVAARRFGARMTEDNKSALRLENGSRILSLPGSEDTIRGFSAVDLLLEDEAGDVAEDIFIAIRPMLAVSRGQHIMMGTPKGRRGHFFEAWERGGDAWERRQITCWNVARFDREFLEQEKRTLGVAFRQEYECEFIAGAFGRVYHAFDEVRNVIQAAPELTNHLLGLDYGFKDETAFTICGWRDHDPTLYVVRSFKRIELIPSDAAKLVEQLNKTYPLQKMVGDVGGIGKGYVEEARRRFQLPIEPADKVNKRGYIDLLNGELARGNVKVVKDGCPELIAEWLELPWDEGRKKEADGYANHCADSCLYAWRASNAFYERPKQDTPRERAEDEWRRKLAGAEDEVERAHLERLESEAADPREWWEKQL